MAYLHGAYGEIGESKVASVTQADVVAAYIGTAPVNLIRGYADKDLVNMPVKVTNMSEVQSLVGYSDDWETFTLGSAFAEHFDNTVGNVGPIYIVNVLDPAVHKSAQKTTKALTFTDGKAEFESDKIILDTFAIADKAEGVDYALSYSMAKHTVTVTLLKETDGAELSATFDTVDTSKVQAADIIGERTETGEYTGLASMALLYQYHNVVLNILAAPGWSHIPAVYKAMVSTIQKLNGHWDGFVHADVPLEDKGTKIDTLAKAQKWAIDNGYTSEFSKVYWPKIKDGNGRIFWLSTVGAATMQRVDLSHDGVPFESPSNKEIMATSQYFGEDSKSRGFDQETANKLNEK